MSGQDYKKIFYKKMITYVIHIFSAPMASCNRCNKMYNTLEGNFNKIKNSNHYMLSCIKCYEKRNERYMEKKDEIKEAITIDYKCECGKTFKYRSTYELDRHLLTKYHQKRVKK